MLHLTNRFHRVDMNQVVQEFQSIQSLLLVATRSVLNFPGKIEMETVAGKFAETSVPFCRTGSEDHLRSHAAPMMRIGRFLSR